MTIVPCREMFTDHMRLLLAGRPAKKSTGAQFIERMQLPLRPIQNTTKLCGGRLSICPNGLAAYSLKWMMSEYTDYKILAMMKQRQKAWNQSQLFIPHGIDSTAPYNIGGKAIPGFTAQNFILRS